MIVKELTLQGVMEPGRLFASPHTDFSWGEPEHYFGVEDVEHLINVLHRVKDHALPNQTA